VGNDTAMVKEALGRARDVDDVASIALRLLNDRPGVVRAGFALSVVGGRHLRFLASDRATLDPPLEWCFIDAYERLPLNEAVRTGYDVALDRAGFARDYPELFASQVDAALRSVVALALQKDERRVGGLLVYRDRELDDPAAELDVLEDLAAEVASALLAAQSSPTDPVELVCQQASDGEIAEAPRAMVHLPLPADETAPGLARRFLAEALGGWGIDATLVDAALLCASEIVTNVVLHVRKPSVITVHRHDERVVVHVHQPITGQSPDIKPIDQDDPLAVAGRGLALVEAMSSHWETTSTGAVSCVRYELRLGDVIA
jgi:anti-sigma regulatory factor (Ser/Thr protein kinase)